MNEYQRISTKNKAFYEEGGGGGGCESTDGKVRPPPSSPRGERKGGRGRKEGESLSVSAKRGRQTEFQDYIPAHPGIDFCNFVKSVMGRTVNSLNHNGDRIPIPDIPTRRSDRTFGLEFRFGVRGRGKGRTKCCQNSRGTGARGVKRSTSERGERGKSASSGKLVVTLTHSPSLSISFSGEVK